MAIARGVAEEAEAATVASTTVVAAKTMAAATVARRAARDSVAATMGGERVAVVEAMLAEQDVVVMEGRGEVDGLVVEVVRVAETMGGERVAMVVVARGVGVMVEAVLQVGVAGVEAEVKAARVRVAEVEAAMVVVSEVMEVAEVMGLGVKMESVVEGAMVVVAKGVAVMEVAEVMGLGVKAVMEVAATMGGERVAVVEEMLAEQEVVVMEGRGEVDGLVVEVVQVEVATLAEVGACCRRKCYGRMQMSNSVIRGHCCGTQ